MKLIKIFFSLIFLFNSLQAVQTETLDSLGFIEAKNQGFTGQGVNILVIDKPVFEEHPALHGNATALSQPDRDANDLETHGTTVSSAIIGFDEAGELNGGAPDAHIYVISPEDFLLIDNNSLPSDVSIVSRSGKFPYPIDTPEAEQFATKLLEYLVRNNAVFVVAAGNVGVSIIDRRAQFMDQGIRFYNAFNMVPGLRERTIFVINASTENDDLIVNKDEEIAQIKEILERNSISVNSYMNRIENMLTETFLSLFGENNFYGSEDSLDIGQFDQDFNTYMNVQIANEYRDLLTQISEEVYNKPILSDADIHITSAKVEFLLKTLLSAELSNGQVYHLANRTNRPGDLFANISISAPGVRIMAAEVERDANGLVYTSKLESGTSIAAPLVSAALALIFQKNPEFTPEEAINSLLNSSHATNSPLFFGRGILNVRGALDLDSDQNPDLDPDPDTNSGDGGRGSK